MSQDLIKQLRDHIKNLEMALELIVAAPEKGKEIYYAVGVAQSALARLRGEVAP